MLHTQEGEQGRHTQEEEQTRKSGVQFPHMPPGHRKSGRERGQGRGGYGSEVCEQEPRGKQARDSEPGAGDSGRTGRGRGGGPQEGGGAGGAGAGDGGE